MTAASLAAASILLGAARLAAGQDAAAIAVREGVARNIYVTVADDKGVTPSDLTPQEVEQLFETLRKLAITAAVYVSTLPPIFWMIRVV